MLTEIKYNIKNVNILFHASCQFLFNLTWCTKIIKLYEIKIDKEYTDVLKKTNKNTKLNENGKYKNN